MDYHEYLQAKAMAAVRAEFARDKEPDLEEPITKCAAVTPAKSVQSPSLKQTTLDMQRLTPPVLPEGWYEHQDHASGALYYVEEHTNSVAFSIDEIPVVHRKRSKKKRKKKRKRAAAAALVRDDDDDSSIPVDYLNTQAACANPRDLDNLLESSSKDSESTVF